MPLNSFQTSGNSPGFRDDRCHVAILGLGTVGAAVAQRLMGPDLAPHLRLTHICDRRARDKRARQGEPLLSLTWTDRFDDLLASDADIIVETMTGSEPSVDYVRAALLGGKSVVTANTQVMARHGQALLTLAERQGRQLRYEAAVGGAIPLVGALGDGLSGDTVLRIDAVLNDTATTVLSQMEQHGSSMDEGIAEACARGIADVDPSVDLDGIDAAAKLAILCGLAFHVKISPDAIETRTSADIRLEDFKKAKLRGGTIRQVAHASFDRASGTLTAWVSPDFVPFTSALAQTSGPENAAIITSRSGGTLTLVGIGGGGEASAVAIVSDLRAIARDRAAIVPAPVLSEPASIVGLSAQTLAEA
ncbi:MAG: homoserine dehydrogenase [Acidobacteriaceae bacterium]|nr:homoserine dehydrogenase [Acidobacteriaceae bacterium]